LKKLAALAFVPIEKVIEYFEGLLENEFYTKNEELLSLLISYRQERKMKISLICN